MLTWIGLVEKAALAICAGAVFLMMLVGAADIVSGLLLGRFLSFKVELSGTLLATSIFLACAVVQKRREHLRVDLFDALMGPRLKRAGALLALLCALVLFTLIAWGLWQQALASVRILEISSDTSGFAIWPWKLAAAAGATLTCVVIVSQIVCGMLGHSERPPE